MRTVEEQIQRALADESATTLSIRRWGPNSPPPPLTVNDARRIIACLENPRFDTLDISHYSLHDDAVLNVFRDDLPLCTSLTTVKLVATNLSNEDLDRLRPAFYNTSVTSLRLYRNNIQGQRGGEVIRDLLIGNNTLIEFNISYTPIGPEGAHGPGRGLTGNNRLQKLNLRSCNIGNDGLANLLLSMDEANNISLTDLTLSRNNIVGEDGGRKLTLLLQCFPALKVLILGDNNLGPLGARALAPGLAAAARHLETLWLWGCGLGNDGVANLILPDGQVNRSLTNLYLNGNDIEGEDGGRKLCLLLQRFPTLKVLSLNGNNSLGPLGAREMAPGLAAASRLESLVLSHCGLGNDGVANLIPHGQVNMSLTDLNINGNGIEGTEGGESVIALVSRCPNLASLESIDIRLSLDQRRRLNFLLDRKRLCTEALALGGSPFPVLFQFMKKAHRHEQGLSAIFVILQNDGDDYFCTALNRATE